MSKKLFYRIGEACKLLEIQPYVLRYWETEFPFLSPTKSKSGQRVYNERELEVIRRIKELLYEEGYTIAGAKKKLEAEIKETSGGDQDSARTDTGKTDAKAPAKAGPEAAETRPVEKKDVRPKKTAAEGKAAAPSAKAEPSAEDTHPPKKTATKRTAAKKTPTRKTATKKTAASRRKAATEATAAPAADLDKASQEQVEKLRSGVEAALSQTRSILELLAN